MRLNRDEARRMALALDIAITICENEAAPSPEGVSRNLRNDSLIHLRCLRSAALRANRDEPEPATPGEPA